MGRHPRVSRSRLAAAATAVQSFRLGPSCQARSFRGHSFRVLKVASGAEVLKSSMAECTTGGGAWLYFWEETTTKRRKEKGWWIGPRVGGDEYYACTSNARGKSRPPAACSPRRHACMLLCAPRHHWQCCCSCHVHAQQQAVCTHVLCARMTLAPPATRAPRLTAARCCHAVFRNAPVPLRALRAPWRLLPGRGLDERREARAGHRSRPRRAPAGRGRVAGAAGLHAQQPGCERRVRSGAQGGGGSHGHGHGHRHGCQRRRRRRRWRCPAQCRGALPHVVRRRHGQSRVPKRGQAQHGAHAPQPNPRGLPAQRQGTRAHMPSAEPARGHQSARHACGHALRFVPRQHFPTTRAAHGGDCDSQGRRRLGACVWWGVCSLARALVRQSPHLPPPAPGHLPPKPMLCSSRCARQMHACVHACARAATLRAAALARSRHLAMLAWLRAECSLRGPPTRRGSGVLACTTDRHCLALATAVLVGCARAGAGLQRVPDAALTRPRGLPHLQLRVAPERQRCVLALRRFGRRRPSAKVPQAGVQGLLLRRHVHDGHWRKQLVHHLQGDDHRVGDHLVLGQPASGVGQGLQGQGQPPA